MDSTTQTENLEAELTIGLPKPQVPSKLSQTIDYAHSPVVVVEQSSIAKSLRSNRSYAAVGIKSEPAIQKATDATTKSNN